MTLFDNIKKYAKLRGMSLSELNDKAGLKTNIIYSWKKKEPSVNKIESVAKVLGVTVDDLLGRENNEKNSRDLEVEEAINSMRSYQGKPITESQREVLRGIIKGYLDSKDK